MNEKVFRQKSLDKIQSPENLNDYVRVSGPGVWLLLAAVLVLLAGILVWGAFGSIETAVSAEARVESGAALCCVSEADAREIAIGMPVELGGIEGTITGSSGDAFLVSTEEPLPDGVYEARVITERIRPLSFVLD